jgi:predicted dienelactone hydrolase
MRVRQSIAMRTVAGLASLLAILVSTGSYGANLEAATGGGAVTRNYSDASRMNWSRTGPRPLVTAIWYPVDKTDDEVGAGTASGDPMFAPVPRMIEGAPLSSYATRYPLILISHGTGGSALGMLLLGHFLASHGYIVVAVNHHGNTGAEAQPDARGYVLWWERAKDLSAVLDRVLTDPVFGPHIDLDKIGAAGFRSAGTQ